MSHHQLELLDPCNSITANANLSVYSWRASDLENFSEKSCCRAD